MKKKEPGGEDLRNAKYGMSIALIFVALILIGEIYVWYVISLYSVFPSTTLYLQEGQQKQDLLEDVQGAAAEVGIGVFVTDTKTDSSFSFTIDVYGTDHAKEKLDENMIHAGEFRSMFLGNVTVNYAPLDQLPEDVVPTYFYLTGSYEENVLFKQQLVDKYAGNFPQEVSGVNGDRLEIIGLWAIVYVFLLLLSMYDIAMIRKEGVVRMVSGEPLTAFVWSNIKKDLVAFTAIFLTLLCITSLFVEIKYYIEITILLYLVFIGLNSMLHLQMLKVDFRRDVSSNQSAKNVLKISYVYKFVAMAVAVFMMNGTISLIKGGIDCYRQGDFFQDYRSYYYFNPASPETYAALGQEWDINLSKELFAERNRLVLVDLEGLSKHEFYVYADDSAKTYLEEEIPELKATQLEQKFYIILPEKYENNESILEAALETWEAYYSATYDYEVIECKQTNTIAMENSGATVTSSIKKDAIILYNNLGVSSYESFSSLGYILQNTLLEVSPQEQEDLEARGIVNFCTNAQENYFFQLEGAKRNMTAGIVFSALILAINLVILKSMVFYDYKINAVELTLKKLFGYGALGRNWRPVLLSVISAVSAILISSLVLHFLGRDGIFYNVVGGGVILLVDLACLLSYMRKMNRVSMNRIVKGGSL